MLGTELSTSPILLFVMLQSVYEEILLFLLHKVKPKKLLKSTQL